MDCVGQPGLDSEFYADFKSGFSFSVRLISISDKTSKVFCRFENVYVFLLPPSNNFTQQESLTGRVSTTDNEPKSWLCKASQWLLVVKILKKPQNFGGFGRNGDQLDKKLKPDLKSA